MSEADNKELITPKIASKIFPISQEQVGTDEAEFTNKQEFKSVKTRNIYKIPEKNSYIYVLGEYHLNEDYKNLIYSDIINIFRTNVEEPNFNYYALLENDNSDDYGGTMANLFKKHNSNFPNIQSISCDKRNSVAYYVVDKVNNEWGEEAKVKKLEIHNMIGFFYEPNLDQTFLKSVENNNTGEIYVGYFSKYYISGYIQDNNITSDNLKKFKKNLDILYLVLIFKDILISQLLNSKTGPDNLIINDTTFNEYKENPSSFYQFVKQIKWGEKMEQIKGEEKMKQIDDDMKKIYTGFAERKDLYSDMEKIYTGFAERKDSFYSDMNKIYQYMKHDKANTFQKLIGQSFMYAKQEKSKYVTDTSLEPISRINSRSLIFYDMFALHHILTNEQKQNNNFYILVCGDYHAGYTNNLLRLLGYDYSAANKEMSIMELLRTFHYIDNMTSDNKYVKKLITGLKDYFKTGFDAEIKKNQTDNKEINEEFKLLNNALDNPEEKYFINQFAQYKFPIKTDFLLFLFKKYNSQNWIPFYNSLIDSGNNVNYTNIRKEYFENLNKYKRNIMGTIANVLDINITDAAKYQDYQNQLIKYVSKHTFNHINNHTKFKVNLSHEPDYVLTFNNMLFCPQCYIYSDFNNIEDVENTEISKETCTSIREQTFYFKMKEKYPEMYDFIIEELYKACNKNNRKSIERIYLEYDLSEYDKDQTNFIENCVNIYGARQNSAESCITQGGNISGVVLGGGILAGLLLYLKNNLLLILLILILLYLIYKLYDGSRIKKQISKHKKCKTA